MRADHRMEPLMAGGFCPRVETRLIAPSPPNTHFSSTSPPPPFSPSFLLSNSRVNKQQQYLNVFGQKTESKLLRENIWPLWFCNMFQNAEFREGHCAKLPALGMAVGNARGSRFAVSSFLQNRNEACKKEA